MSNSGACNNIKLGTWSNCSTVGWLQSHIANAGTRNPIYQHNAEDRPQDLHNPDSLQFAHVAHLPLPQDDDKLHEEEDKVAQMVAVPHGQEHQRQELRRVPVAKETQPLVHVPGDADRQTNGQGGQGNGRHSYQMSDGTTMKNDVILC